MVDPATPPSFDASESHSLLPWLDESLTATSTPLLLIQPDYTAETEDLIAFDGPTFDPASLTALSPDVSTAPPEEPSPRTETLEATLLPTPAIEATSDVLPSLRTSWCKDPPSQNVECDLRATVDALLKRKKASQRGIADENASLREEVSFLRDTLRLASPEDSDAKQLAAALEQERTERLRSQATSDAHVDYLVAQLASSNKEQAAVEQALTASDQELAVCQDKLAAAMERCEALEEENRTVKSSLGLFARQRPGTVRQQMQGMLYEVAEERANLRKLEVLEQAQEKAGQTRDEVKRIGTFNYPRRGNKKQNSLTQTKRAGLSSSNHNLP
ncbi:hypothetical protein C2E23DRAFT_867646 [Lenzites betulinus]|nr:hypothetical protein C2E23DRAFT_867646 [Lenzites betulinus]